MAYQPIQLPNQMGISRGLENFGNALESVGQISRERERYEAEKKRQAQFDFQQAYQTAANLAEKGDIAGAQAIMAQYAPQMQNLDAEQARIKQDMGIGAGPQAPLTSNFYGGQQQPPPPQGGSAVPDGMDGGRSMGAGPADTTEADAAFMGMQAPTPVQPPPMQGPDVDQLMQQATGGAPQDAQLNPILAGFGKDRERQQAMARRVLSVTAPGGQKIDMDLDARRNFAQQQQDQERERNAQLAQQAFAETGDPKLMFFNLVKSGFGVESAGKMVAEMVEQRQKAEAAATAKVDDRQYARTEEERRDARNFEQQKELARLNASLGVGKTTIVQPGAEASGAGQVLSGLRSDLKEWTEQSGYERVSKELSASARTLKAIESGNPKLVQQAIFAYGKETAGVGSFTRDEQDAIINKTGGSWEQVVNAFNQAKEGVYSPETIRIFRDAMAIKAQSARGELEQIHGSFQNKFRGGAAYQNVQQNMFDEEKTLFGRYGLSPTPPEEGAGGVSYATPSMAKRGGARPAPAKTGSRETQEERKRRLRSEYQKMNGQ